MEKRYYGIMMGCVGGLLCLWIIISCVIGNEYTISLTGCVAIKFLKKFCIHRFQKFLNQYLVIKVKHPKFEDNAILINLSTSELSYRTEYASIITFHSCARFNLLLQLHLRNERENTYSVSMRIIWMLHQKPVTTGNC